MQNIGALISVHEKQRYSAFKMIESFRKHNNDSSIVIYCDGIVSDVNEICKEYKCECVIFPEKVGYPASKDINIPLEYLRRILYCSTLIKENYYLNLEADVLVTANLQVDDDCTSFCIFPCETPAWIYWCHDNKSVRNAIMSEIFDLYKLYGVYREDIFDRIVGGGAQVLNKKFFLKILNDWDAFKARCFLIKNICDKHNFLNDGEHTWVYDYMLSFQLPFYLENNYFYKNDPYVLGTHHNDMIKKHIIHPYKNFYV